MKILVVDDETKIADVLAERLSIRGFDATPVYDGNSALEQFQSQPPDGMILDLRLPDIDGIEVLRKTKKHYPDTIVIILSGHASEQDFETCRDLGALACFQKPASIADIIQTFENKTKES